MNFKGQNILSTKQFDKESMEKLFRRAKEMEKVLDGQSGWLPRKAKSTKGFSKLFDGKILATLFYEPSTRTRFSFESAFLRLGGKVVSGADMVGTSSARKGETLYDTGKVVSRLVDLIVMRHPDEGSVEELARGSSVPVINAGDGPNQHPTQALLDVYTIWKERGGKLDGLTIGMVGDLKYGRVPHSQCDLLKHWKVEFVFVSPKELRMPWEVKDDLSFGGGGGMGGGKSKGGFAGEVGGGLSGKVSRKFFETEDLKEVIGDLDVILATRIQKERFKSPKEAEKYAGIYVIDRKMMSSAKRDALLMHPLPRVDEIAVEVDKDGRARYFDQVRNGLVLRMALMDMVMGR